MTLEAAVRMVTGTVAEALTCLAPRRAAVAPGYVADLVVSEPGRLSGVREVLVSGGVVERPRRLR